MLKEDLQNQWGREPTVGELSERLGVEQEELVMALDAGGDVESLHKPIYQKDGQEIRLMDKLEEKSEEHEQVLNHIVLTELLGVLNQDEKKTHLSALFCGADPVPGRTRAWNFTGSGLKNGKENTWAA